MTEKLSTTGVYTSEVNQSFIAPIQVPDGCAIVGPTQKGEAYVPTSVQSPGQFSAIFGTETSNTYVPQAVYNYLQAGDSILVTRVLGNGGWQYTPAKSLAAIVQPAVSASLGSTASVSIPTASLLSSISGSNQQLITLAGANTEYFYGYDPTPVVVSGSIVVDVPATATLYITDTGSIGSNVIYTLNDPQSGSTVLGSYSQITTGSYLLDVAYAISSSISGNSLNYTSSVDSKGNVVITAPYGKGDTLNGSLITLSSVPEVRASGSLLIPAPSAINNSYMIVNLSGTRLFIYNPASYSTNDLGNLVASQANASSGFSASYNSGTTKVTFYAPIGLGYSGNNLVGRCNIGAVSSFTFSGGSYGTHTESPAYTTINTSNLTAYTPSVNGSYCTFSLNIVDTNNNLITSLGLYTIMSSDIDSQTVTTHFLSNINALGNQGFTLTPSATYNQIYLKYKPGHGSSVNTNLTGGYICSLVYTEYDSTGNAIGYGGIGTYNFIGGVDPALPLDTPATPFEGGVTGNTGSYQVIKGGPDTDRLGAIYFINTGSKASQVSNLLNTINNYSSLTNVTGSLSGGSIVLSSITTGSIYNSYYAGSAPTSSGIVPSVSQSMFYGGLDSIAAVPGSVIGILHPSLNNHPSLTSLNNSNLFGTSNNSLSLSLSGNQVNQSGIVSMYNTDKNFYTKVLGTNAQASTGGAFAYLYFQSASLSSTTPVTLALQTGNCTFTSSYAEGYDSAATPWVLSDANTRLFYFEHRSQGFMTNTDVKVSITNITVNPDPSIFTTFSILVRQYGDTDKTPVILEQYNQVTLNPDAPNYIANVIGDKYNYYDSLHNKVVSKGEFDNVSNYIRVVVSEMVSKGNVAANTSISGHEPLFEPIAGFGSLYSLPAIKYVQSNSGSYLYSGFDFSNVDNSNYLNPVPLEAGYGNNIPFTLPSNDNKFTLPLQGGTDGTSYSTIKKIGSDIAADGTNVFGFDLSSVSSTGYLAFKQALDILSNTQLYKYGILTMPGVIEQYHGAVTAYAQAMVETRKDTVYLRDLTGVDESVNAAIEVASGLDSTYSATYYPWVKVNDIGSSKKIYVPPTVLVPQAVAYTDRNAAPWVAVAGTGRGTLGGAIDTKNRLSKAEQGALYDANINPIAKAPNTGVVIFGQKTLSKQSTALNRLNVRRLLITLKDYISTLAADLVFDQNLNSTRTTFVNKVNPYLQTVQQNGGITAFSVRCDSNNNSNTDVANHILNCKIQIIPTMSIEYILLEFDITPQGAVFS